MRCVGAFSPLNGDKPSSSDFSYLNDDATSGLPFALPLPLGVEDESYFPSFSVDIETQAVFSYDSLPGFCSSSLRDDDGYACEVKCVNPAVLHAPAPDVPEFDPQEAQSLNLNSNLDPQPQDIQEVCDLNSSELVATTSKLKRSRQLDCQRAEGSRSFRLHSVLRWPGFFGGCGRL